MAEKKIGAVWTRVSTEEDSSLADQVSRAKEKLEVEGYIVPEDRILKANWGSENLSDCPEMKQLESWIKQNEIQAIGVFNTDFLHADSFERMSFGGLCKAHNVKMFSAQGK
jgi:hypothetical protein